MKMKNKPELNGHAKVHYRQETPTEIAQGIPATSKSMETNQIHDVQIVRTAPPTQEFMPLGYNREAIIDRVARANFWNFGVSLNPAHVEEYSPTGYINAEQYARSVTEMYGVNSNHFIWDQLPELENLPVSGHPQEVQQQYVMYNVEPSWLASAQKSLHIHAQSTPTAYNAITNTSKSQTVVYQTPVTAIQEMISGSSAFKALKTWLVGS